MLDDAHKNGDELTAIFATILKTEPVSAISASLLMHAVSGCHAVA
jgi:hypothetical protein